MVVSGPVVEDLPAASRVGRELQGDGQLRGEPPATIDLAAAAEDLADWGHGDRSLADTRTG
jgi:hypothetical protein